MINTEAIWNTEFVYKDPNFH